MAAQKGSALLLKIGADASAAAASDTYTTVGGLRSTSITLNQESVDITNKDSANARELLADAGVEPDRSAMSEDRWDIHHIATL